MDPKLSKNNFYKSLFRTFDKSLMSMLDKAKSKMVAAIERVETRLSQCEEVIGDMTILLVEKCKNELSFADGLVKKEMRCKILMSDWTGKFLLESSDNTLDPITFAFTRYCLNIALSFRDVTARRLLESNVHRQLVDYASYPSELVAGPALLALVHISLFPDLKPAIVLAGVLPALLPIMAQNKSKAVLCQACKLIASLALYFPNKSQILNSGCFHGVLDLIIGTGRDIDDFIQIAALCAVVNVTMGNDASRTLMVELNGIKPIITAIQTSTNNTGLLRAITALANVSYCNSFTSGKILTAGGHLALLELLQASDLITQADVVRLSFSALSNLCNNDTSQTFVGGTAGLCEAALRACEHAEDPLLVADAALFLLAIMYDNRANKSRVASKGACGILVKRIARELNVNAEENIFCFERLCFALASMLIVESHHEQMAAIGGLETIVSICKQHSHDRILRALAQIVSAMCPTADLLFRYHDEHYKSPIERVGEALPVLKKLKFNGFGKHKSIPEWLEKPIAYLSMDDGALQKEPHWIKAEFVDKLTYTREFQVEVEADAAVLQDKDCRGLVMSSF